MLDNNTMDWYREQASKQIKQCMDALRKEIPEEQTRSIRARIKVLEEVRNWKFNEPSNDAEIEFL